MEREGIGLKYDDLFFCRMMMRCYSLPPFAEDLSELEGLYRRLEPELTAAFFREGIRPTPVKVTSDFNGTVDGRLELVFCYKKNTFPIPERIYRLFYDYGVVDFMPPPEPPVVRFGYTGRCYDYKTKTRFVTDGLQIGALGKIVLDLFSLSAMTRDGVSCRLTHELLHVFGVSEENMMRYKPRAFQALGEELAAFSDILLAALPGVIADLSRIGETLQIAHPDWVETLVQIGRWLYLAGFPGAPEEVLTARVSLPLAVSSQGDILWRERDILFM